MTIYKFKNILFEFSYGHSSLNDLTFDLDANEKPFSIKYIYCFKDNTCLDGYVEYGFSELMTTRCDTRKFIIEVFSDIPEFQQLLLEYL